MAFCGTGCGPHVADNPSKQFNMDFDHGNLVERTEVAEAEEDEEAEEARLAMYWSYPHADSSN